MNSKLINTLKNYNANTTGVKRESSVLLPLILKDGEWNLMYEVRASTLNSQPGEICFPGGKMECHENAKEAAVRETCEELNIRSEDIEVIGRIDSVMTSFNMLIHCYVGIIHKNFEDIKYSKDEVDHLFLAPVSYMCKHEPLKYNVKTLMELPEDFPYDNIPEGRNYNFKTSSYPVIFYQYYNKTIWGLTARMTESFIELVSNHCEDFSPENLR